MPRRLDAVQKPACGRLLPRSLRARRHSATIADQRGRPCVAPWPYLFFSGFHLAAEAAYGAASLRAAIFEVLDHGIEIGIAGAEASCEPVSTALGDPLAVSDNLELTGLPRCKDDFNVEALLDEGRETRDLGLVVLSCRAVNDLDLHYVLQSASCSPGWLNVRRGANDNVKREFELRRR